MIGLYHIDWIDESIKDWSNNGLSIETWTGDGIIFSGTGYLSRTISIGDSSYIAVYGYFSNNCYITLENDSNSITYYFKDIDKYSVYLISITFIPTTVKIGCNDSKGFLDCLMTLSTENTSGLLNISRIEKQYIKRTATKRIVDNLDYIEDIGYNIEYRVTGRCSYNNLLLLLDRVGDYILFNSYHYIDDSSLYGDYRVTIYGILSEINSELNRDGNYTYSLRLLKGQSI